LSGSIQTAPGSAQVPCTRLSFDIPVLGVARHTHATALAAEPLSQLRWEKTRNKYCPRKRLFLKKGHFRGQHAKAETLTSRT
jgi:hypothetical protein